MSNRDLNRDYQAKAAAYQESQDGWKRQEEERKRAARGEQDDSEGGLGLPLWLMLIWLVSGWVATWLLPFWFMQISTFVVVELCDLLAPSSSVKWLGIALRNIALYGGGVGSIFWVAYLLRVKKQNPLLFKRIDLWAFWSFWALALGSLFLVFGEAYYFEGHHIRFRL